MTQLAPAGGSAATTDTSADNVGGHGGETVAPQPYRLSDAPGPLGREELAGLDAWWRAANYLAVGQIYLTDNPLLRDAAAGRARQAAAARPFRHGARAEPGVGARQPAIRAREPRRGLRRRTGSRRARVRTPAPGSRAPTPSCTATSRRTPTGMPAFFRPVLLSPAACPATARPRRPVRSTRAASWATRCCTPSARRWTIPI